MKLKIRVSIIVVILSVVLVFLLTPFYCYHDKKIHISIDDVWESFNDISRDSLMYNDVFEHPFFCKLKKAHELTGAKFTLYVYENVEDYSIDDIPQKYITQINCEKDWLRVGFHASNDTINRDSIGVFPSFSESFTRVSEKLAGGAKTLRLQFYFATPDEVAFLGENGINTLLSADDDRISYSLPANYNDSLIINESLQYKNMLYERTDIRVEKDGGPFVNLYKNRNDDKLVLFTHEWALHNRRTEYELWFYLIFFSIYNCDFIID